MRRPPPCRSAFTMIELLVVMAIMGILVALSVTGIQKVRARGDAITCQNNLHNLGLALEMFRDSNLERFPTAARYPGIGPDPALPEVLGPFVESSERTFRCPADSTHFPAVKISYEYPDRVSGRTFVEVTRSGQRGSDQIWLLYDFDPFHGSPGTGIARNFLYLDGHVANR